MDVRVGPQRRLSSKELMLLNCGVREDSWESLGLQGDPTSPSGRKSTPNIHWKDWGWNWSSNSLAWCKEPLERPWCRERLKAGGEGDNRRQDSWMASQTQWTWVWASSRRWWRTGKPGELQSMGHKELDVTEQLNNHKSLTKCPFSSDLGYELLNYYFMFATILWSCLSTLTWQWRNISWLQPPNK